jgi:hypothetical protein
MRGNTTKGQHFGSQLYLTMKVICTSQQENVAQSQSTRHHSWQRENLPPPCGWKNSCRQSFCRQNRCERSHLFLRAPQSRISQAPNYRSYLGSRARTERRRRNQHHKGANYGWPVVTYGIDYDGTTISDKTKSQEWRPIYYWVPSIAPAEWPL